MPNPFSKVQQPKTRTPRQVVRSLVSDEEQEITQPVPELYQPTGYDYQRGANVHGVESKPWEPDPRENYSGVVDVHMDPPPKRDEPVRVVVVHDEDRTDEITEWRTAQQLVSNTPKMIVNRMRSRQKVSIRNTGATAILIGPNGNLNGTNGWSVPAGSAQELATTEEVWAYGPGLATDVFITVEIVTFFTVNV